MTFAACGSDSGQSGTSAEVAATSSCPRGPTVTMSKAEIAKLPPLTIPKPQGPPPHKLVHIDLREGSGPGVPADIYATNGEKVNIRYYVVGYPDARRGVASGEYGPIELLPDELTEGTALGLAGMKVGGRREIITPPELVYPRWKPSWGYAPYVNVYVVDLLGMKPPPDRRVEHRSGGSC